MLPVGYCGGMGLGGWLLVLGFWLGIIAVVLWAVSHMFPSVNRRGEADDMLDRRLASGEIDPATYRRLRDELARNSATQNRRLDVATSGATRDVAGVASARATDAKPGDAPR